MRPPASTWDLPAAQCGTDPAAVPPCPADAFASDRTWQHRSGADTCRWTPAPIPSTLLNTSSSLSNASEGITNDATSFYFNGDSEMWRADPRRGYAVTNHKQSAMPPDLRAMGYRHMGDTVFLPADASHAAGVVSRQRPGAGGQECWTEPPAAWPVRPFVRAPLLLVA